MTIPSDFLPVEGQTGLYYKDRSYVINGESFTARELRADDNHCFYDIKDPEEERIYMEWGTIRAEITSDFVCIPREEWMEIASKNGEPELA